ncbi:MAG: nucleotidyl transferase AbiEii/AbiGii toxin family protein [Bacteroidota bacterium]
MIPEQYITEWQSRVFWQTNEQVEQDLVICRALVEIFNNPYLAESVAFRGGTALHKLYLNPQKRYSEDIDLVQMKAEPIGDILNEIRMTLSFLGKAAVVLNANMATMKFKFQTEIAPVTNLKLKIETNCREHFTELGWIKHGFSVDSGWFSGSCDLTTYYLEELLGTKLRALYQRKKGRDLYDLYVALKTTDLDVERLLLCYRRYMSFSVEHPPTSELFIENMEEKMTDRLFVNDMKSIIKPSESFDIVEAYELVKEKILLKI